MDRFSLVGKTAIVTGASRGLGRTFANALARAGADVAVTARDAASLNETCRDIEALGRRAVPVALDVRDQASITRAVDQAQHALGGIDILVNNAGCNVRKRALDVTWDDWNLVLDTNLRGTFFVAQAVARHMISRGYGRVINIGSVTSVFGYAGVGPYAASRGGVRQLTMSLADDWGVHGVTVNCLAPGWFKTRQNAVMYEDQAWVDYVVDRIPLKRTGAPRTWKERSSSSPPTRAPTSPDRRCWWTAASRPAPSARCRDEITEATERTGRHHNGETEKRSHKKYLSVSVPPCLRLCCCPVPSALLRLLLLR